ncbi:hypothetical protein PCASD_08104 [Puccinia coronata f. sp. avenae]|uniref:Integrase catalytic domain-containing protein n=1 Tax=Puccinia coronata f. sp. avenae TaxID=200324 RepID=A0A2N5VAC4_9BASI|nr:hypothetical protein PCASD_08104 [Puccinia coronata f. sp. avenae]
MGSILSDALKQRIIEGYASDGFCQSLKAVPPLQDNCFEREGLLYVDDRLLIPRSKDLLHQLISEAHDRLGHLGFLKAMAELRRDFFWPGMTRDTTSFVRSCLVCRRTKAPTTAPTGKMLTPSIPQTPLRDLAIDFVGPLKSTAHYDMILTCTDRLSGFVRIIPVLQKDTAEKTAARFFTGWLATFGSPATIISDRDKTWTSKFWKSLMDRLNIKFHMTLAFHPQADGRSKRSNKTIGQILRTFTAKKQSRWLESLPAVEFAINSAVNVSTGFSPFYKVRQALQHNKRCRPRPPIAEGSWALLDSADWRGRHQTGTDKLKERYEGPYRVKRVFNNGQNVELDLPPGDRRHPALHISKVKPFVEFEPLAGKGLTKVSSPQLCTAG